MAQKARCNIEDRVGLLVLFVLCGDAETAQASQGSVFSVLLQEEDMLNIQFSMVELQNRCSDQGAASSVFELSAVLESLP